MTEQQAKDTLLALLQGLGVVRGETIYVAADMARLPLPRWKTELSRAAIRKRESDWCQFIFQCIQELLGPDGTVLVGTFSYSCANPANRFELEKTPSEIGPFTEWLRIQPAAIRSLHPVFSVSGIGRNAEPILSQTGGAAFGPLSPFGRLAEADARFVNLGIPFSQSLTYIHHLEQCYGSTHRYHKQFGCEVWAEGQQVTREFLGYMRWRGVDAGVDVSPIEQALWDQGLLHQVDQEGLFGQATKARDVERVGYELLARDSSVFSKPAVKVAIDDSLVVDSPSKDLATTFKLIHL